MDNRGLAAMGIARQAQLLLMPVREIGAVRRVGCVLEVGPLASADEIATVSCRCLLARSGVHSETEVLGLVERYGFAYVPASWTSSRARLAS